MRRHQEARTAKSVLLVGIALAAKTTGIVAWGASTTLVLGAVTAICVLLLFAPPFVFLLPLCARGAALAAKTFGRSIIAVRSEWRALGAGPAGSSGSHAYQGS